jgi:hypothetical protein
MNDTTIADVSYTLRSVENGYVLERGWKEIGGPGEFDYRWKDSKNIFSSYEEVLDYMKKNII